MVLDGIVVLNFLRLPCLVRGLLIMDCGYRLLKYLYGRGLFPTLTDVRFGQVTSFGQSNIRKSDILLAPRNFKCHLWLYQCLSLFPLPGELHTSDGWLLQSRS